MLRSASSSSSTLTFASTVFEKNLKTKPNNRREIQNKKRKRKQQQQVKTETQRQIFCQDYCVLGEGEKKIERESRMKASSTSETSEKMPFSLTLLRFMSCLTYKPGPDRRTQVCEEDGEEEGRTRGEQEQREKKDADECFLCGV